MGVRQEVSGYAPNGEGKKHPPIIDIIHKCLPYYMAMGMTYEQFMEGDPELAKFYREAYDIKQHEQNTMLWLQGRYVYDAIISASPLFMFKPSKPHDYVERPYPLTIEEANELKEKKQQQLAYDFVKSWAEKVNKEERYAKRD